MFPYHVAAEQKRSPSAKANGGYHFKGWQVISGGVTISGDSGPSGGESGPSGPSGGGNGSSGSSGGGNGSSGPSGSGALSDDGVTFSGDRIQGHGPFADAKETDWFYTDMMFVYENSLMTGTSTIAFAPYDNATRTQLAVIFYRMEGSPKVGGKNGFTDVEYGPGTVL